MPLPRDLEAVLAVDELAGALHGGELHLVEHALRADARVDGGAVVEANFGGAEYANEVPNGFQSIIKSQSLM